MNLALRMGRAGLVVTWIAARSALAAPQPTAEIVAPEPTPTTEPEPPPAPAPEPEPTPTPVPEPIPAPLPEPEPAPAPAPGPELTPAPAIAPAPAHEGSSLEGFVSLGPSYVFGDPANPAYTQSFSRVGVFGEAGVAYRSHYFIDPFLSVGYAKLATGKSTLPDGPWGAGGTLDQDLDEWVITPGVTADIWRFRLRFGLGIAIVEETNTFLADKHSSSQLVLASQYGLGFNVLDIHRFRLDAEARLVRAQGADVTFMSLAVVARGDLICFRGCP